MEERAVHRCKVVLLFVLVNMPTGGASAIAQNSYVRGNRELIQKVIDRASFEFTNEGMYRNQDQWIGKTVAFRGTFTRYTDILNTEKPYEQCAGMNSNRDPIDFIVFFDTPLLIQPKDVMSGQTVSRSEQFYIFGLVNKCREVVSRTGTVKILPVMDLLLVYRADDQTFQYPIWVSKSLQN
jgi:hypothetical protein